MKIKIPKISPKLAEEIGWHIGDGSMNYYKINGKLIGFYQLRGHIEDDKLHYLKRIKPIFDSIYGVDIHLRDMPSTRVFGFQIWNSEIVKFKHNLGLPLGKKLNVSIPKLFLKNTKLKSAIIRGIFDTDGGIYLERRNKNFYPRLEIRTISFILSQQLLDILTDLGLRTTRHSELFNKDFNRHRAYVISVRGDKMFSKFMKVISLKNPKHIAKYNLFLNSKGL